MLWRGCVMLAALLSASPAAALTPLAPAGSYDEVCRRLPAAYDVVNEIQEIAKVATDSAAPYENLERRLGRILWDIAYSRDTMLTVDADDLDDIFAQIDAFMTWPGPELAPHFSTLLDRFAKKYRCRIPAERTPETNEGDTR